MARNNPVLNLDKETRFTTIAWRMFLIVNCIGWSSRLIFWFIFNNNPSHPSTIIIVYPYAFLIFANLAIFFLTNIAGRIGEPAQNKRILIYIAILLSIWIFYATA